MKNQPGLESDKYSTVTIRAPDETYITVRELARQIAALEQDIPIQEATGEDYHSVYTALTQTHLPQLSEIKAIEYDQNRKRVYPAVNLVPITLIASLTTPVAKLLFSDAAATLFDRTKGPKDSIGDL